MRRPILVFTVLMLASNCLRSGMAQESDDEMPRLTTELLRGLELRNIATGYRPGRIADIAVDPRNRSTWYVATAAGGLWKTTNRGTTWAPIFDDYGSYSLGYVTIDPRDSNVVWLGTGENQSLRSVSFGDGVYKSTDAGETWTKVGLGESEHIAKIIVDPRDSDVVYVAAQGPLWARGGDRGLYKTTDGGETWEAILTISENTGITDLVLDPRDPDVMYAAAYQRRRHVGVLIGGGPEAGIFKSVDGGENWNKLSEGLPAVDKGRIALAISPHNPDVVYAWMNAASDETGFFRSADGGETWVRRDNIRVQDPQFYGEIYADPHQFDRVYVMDTRIQVTEDGGATFRRVNWSMHVDNHTMTFDPTDENHLLVGNDGGLYETYDGGRTWRHFTNMPIPQLYAVGASNELPFYYVYGGAQDNGSQGAPSRTIHRDGIRTSEWINVGGADGMQPRVDPENGNIVYTMSQSGAIQRLDKRTGESASIRPRVGDDDRPVRWNWLSPFIISPHAPQRLYLAGSKLFRSDDRGDNWRLVSPDLTRDIHWSTIPVFGRVWGEDEDVVSRNTFTTAYGVGSALSESPLEEGLLYFGTDDHLIQVSEDGGENWRKIESFLDVPDKAMVTDLVASSHDANTVYAAFNNYLYGDFQPYLLKSSDRGETWQSIVGNLPDRHFVWSIVEDPVNKDLLFAGTEFGLFVTIDGGNTWAQIRSGAPTAAFRDLEIQRRENDLVAATFGRGFFILDDYTPLRHLTPQLLAQEAALLQISDAWLFHELGYTRAVYGNSSSPNPPFGAALTYYLKSDMPADTPLVLAVKNADGQEIRRMNGPTTAGIHRVAWDLRAQAAAGGGRRGGRGSQLEPSAEETAELEAGLEAELEMEEQFEIESAGQQPGPQDAAQPPEGQRQRGRGGARQGRGGRGGFGRGGRGGFGRGGRRGRGGRGGPLVEPGMFTVTLNKLVDGELTPLGEPQEFQVTPLPTASSAASDTVVAP